MKDKRVVNTERVSCFSKEESDWNDFVNRRDEFVSLNTSAFNGATS